MNATSCRAAICHSTALALYPPATVATDLSTAARHFIAIISNDASFATELRTIDLNPPANLWNDYPFDIYFGQRPARNRNTFPATQHEKDLQARTAHLYQALLDLPHDIHAIFSAHRTELETLDRALNVYVFKRAWIYTNPLVTIWFRNSTNCRRFFPLRFLPPFLPLYPLTTASYTSASSLFETYSHILFANAYRLSYLNVTLAAITADLAILEPQMHALVVQTVPPPDQRVETEWIDWLAIRDEKGGEGIPWLHLSPKVRAKVLKWKAFAEGAYTVPVKAWGDGVGEWVKGLKTRKARRVEGEEEEKEEEKGRIWKEDRRGGQNGKGTEGGWEIWDHYNRDRWLRIRELARLVRKVMREVEEARDIVGQAREGLEMVIKNRKGNGYGG
ncbi:hypothetical protein LZ554_009536 [Drepanopeziza brunnea f. sp. 'monogermtubi']|nr:hypothetical protein LZ554_009536 [Drepanopeziza brunnea f. sp. 'monogermtubi']